MDEDVAVKLIVNDLRQRFRDTIYDPVAGIGCIGRRVEVFGGHDGRKRVYVPKAMIEDPDYRISGMTKAQWQRLRCRHDFEYWCATCAVVKIKTSEHDGPFILNPPQRRVAAVLERDRVAGLPIRLILLKARQWGGSTLIQMYMGWIQSCRRRNWNSLICAHVKDAASGIRGMYTKVARQLSPRVVGGRRTPQFKPYERSINVRQIAGAA